MDLTTVHQGCCDDGKIFRIGEDSGISAVAHIDYSCDGFARNHPKRLVVGDEKRTGYGNFFRLTFRNYRFFPDFSLKKIYFVL